MRSDPCFKLCHKRKKNLQRFKNVIFKTINQVNNFQQGNFPNGCVGDLCTKAPELSLTAARRDDTTQRRRCWFTFCEFANKTVNLNFGGDPRRKTFYRREFPRLRAQEQKIITMAVLCRELVDLPKIMGGCEK